MNKFNKDSIIYLDGFIYLVDRELRAKQGWNYNFALKRTMNLSHEYEEHTSEWNYCFKIIATNNPSLQGVDKFSLPKIDTKEIALHQAYKELISHPHTQWPRILARLWEAKKEYTEEDVRNAIHNARIRTPNNNAYTWKTDYGDFKLTPDEIVQSLTPKIIEVELEAYPDYSEDIKNRTEGKLKDALKERSGKLKHNDKGELIIKSIKYEEAII